MADEEDNLFGSIGFMFDASHQKIQTSIEFSNGSVIKLNMIGDDAGHKQSGQYLWPAAKFAGTHIIEHWESLLKAVDVIELGAGCGLAGLVIGHLPGVQNMIFTDYDPGSLQLIEDNISLNLASLSAVLCSTQFLEWGQPFCWKELKPKLSQQDGKFGLVVGTDLIYCKEVVDPLFKTVAELLSTNNPGIFVLVTSFALEESIQIVIENACSQYFLNKTVVQELCVAEHVCKVEYYSHASS